ncbi:MAG: hypothetical protein JWQ27_3101 [Ferruginibacter sp.]|nr:hypothetical protein [Ferruginibacter sp.]
MTSTGIPGFELYLHENLGWERALDFWLQENAYLKVQLAKMLDLHEGKDMTTLGERFQNSFIQNDELIQDMQQDIVSMQQELKTALAGKENRNSSLLSRHSMRRNEMKNYEQQFALLKNEFNQVLSVWLKSVEHPG